MTRFMATEERTSNRYTNDFYKSMEDMNAAYYSVLRLAKAGDTKKARQLAMEEAVALGNRQRVLGYSKYITKLNRQINATNAAAGLSAQEKRDRLDRLYESREKLARAAVKVLQQ